jgi:hypothetical protein
MPYTTVAYLADIHIGNHVRFTGTVESGVNGRCREILDALRKALAFAEREGAEAVVVCGDVFDTDRPSPQVLAAAMNVIGATRLPVILLKGNHDTHTEDTGDHSLATMHHLPSVAVLDSPAYMEDMDIMAVPFSVQQVGRVTEYLRAVCSKGTGSTVLAGHFGISHKDTPWFLAGSANSAPDKDLVSICKDYGYASVVAGDWHVPYQSADRFTGTVLCQVGALCPVDFNDGESSGGVVLVENGVPTRRLSIPGPRFITVRTADDIREREDCHHAYVRVMVPNEIAKATTALARSMWPKGSVVYEPHEVDRPLDASVVTRHWSSNALEEAALEWANEHVPADMRTDVVFNFMRLVHTARNQ